MTPVSSQEYIVPKIILSHFRDLGERTSMGSTELNLFFTSSVLLLLPLIVAQQPVVLNLTVPITQTSIAFSPPSLEP